MVTHTPTPWESIESNASSFVHIETSSDHRTIASVNSGTRNERRANAAFIAQACNNYDEMIKTLQTILLAVGNKSGSKDTLLANIESWAAAALKLTKGDTHHD